MTEPIRVVITGIGGQLGGELMRAPWPDHVVLVGLDRSALDLSQTQATLAKIVALRPSVIVNCAAYT